MIHKDINIGGVIPYAVLDFNSDIMIGQIKANNGIKGLGFINNAHIDKVIGKDVKEIPPQVIMFFRNVEAIDAVINQLNEIRNSMKPKIITDENTNGKN